MAKQGAEARPLETGPEQQPQAPKAAPQDVKGGKTLEKGIADVKGILSNAAPEQMLAAPAALETLPALEPSKWEQVKGWTSGVLGKMREAFKKPVPPTLDQLHDQQIAYIEKYLEEAKLSKDDRENLRQVVLNHLDATERNPVVIAERMKAVLWDHNARMQQMDVIAKKMQGALETGKTEELGKEQMKLDPETSAAISRTYEKLKALKPDMRTPDKRAQTQWDLLNNPTALASFLRQDIPNGESLTNQQILTLAKTLSSALQKEDLDRKHSAAEEKAEKEKQEQASIAKMKKVAAFVNKYPDVQEPEDDKIDEFLAKMAAREQAENDSKLSQAALEQTNKARTEQISKLIEAGRRSMNVEKLIDEASMAAASNNFDKGILTLRNSLASASDMIDRELVTVSKSGELNMNADPKEFVRRIDVLLDSSLAKNGLLLSELDRGRIRDMLKSSIVSKYNEKLAQLAKTTPESQLGKKQVMEQLAGVGASLEKTKTDRLQSIEALLNQNLTKDQEKALGERRQEIELRLGLDKDFTEWQKKGWADVGPDGKRRMTAAGLIAVSSPHWGTISVEQRSKIEALQNETLDINKKIQANNETLAKIQEAYEKKQDQVVDDLQKARDGLLTKYKGEVIEEDVQKHFLDLVKTNLAENKMSELYEELAKHLTDDISEHNADLAEEEPEDLTDLLEDYKAVPPPTPEAALKKAKEKQALENFAKSEGTGLAEAAQILKEKGKEVESMSIRQADSYLKELLAKNQLVDPSDADLKGIIEDINVGLAGTPRTAEAIKLKVFAAIAEHNKKISSKPVDAQVPEVEGQEVSGVRKKPEAPASELKSEAKAENDNAEVQDIIGTNEAANDNAKDINPETAALEALKNPRWAGLDEIADVLDHGGNLQLANKLREDNLEMSELFRAAARNEDLIATENIAEEGHSNQFSEILTSIKNNLSVYPLLATAVEQNFKSLAAKQNKRFEDEPNQAA